MKPQTRSLCETYDIAAHSALADHDLAHILQLAPNLIYVYDHAAQSNVYSNRELADTLGYSGDEVRGMGDQLMPTIIHPDDLDKVFAHFAHIRSLTDGVTATLDYRVKHKAGHWVWLLSHDCVFQRDISGAVRRHIGVASDITKQKDAQARAIAAEKKASAINEELREFAYAMSHDMKAPSNTMEMILSEMEMELQPAKGSDIDDLMGLAQTTIARMQLLVDEVLDYTRFVGQDVPFEDVDLNQTLRCVLSVMRADIVSANATVRVDPLPIVRGARSQLHSYFQNMIQNAVKFSQNADPPQITVRATEVSDDSRVAIEVQDNGIGIAPEQHDHVFKMFKRLNPEAHFDGTGLGLATCRRVAINHKSEVTLQSELGAGATFSIELDRACGT